MNAYHDDGVCVERCALGWEVRRSTLVASTEVLSVTEGEAMCCVVEVVFLELKLQATRSTSSLRQALETYRASTSEQCPLPLTKLAHAELFLLQFSNGRQIYWYQAMYLCKFCLAKRHIVSSHPNHNRLAMLGN